MFFFFCSPPGSRTPTSLVLFVRAVCIPLAGSINICDAMIQIVPVSRIANPYTPAGGLQIRPNGGLLNYLDDLHSVLTLVGEIPVEIECIRRCSCTALNFMSII